MLTNLRIKNFKSLADTGDLAIKPLTFLVGPNSAGKSSVLQALLLLRQTVDERDPTIPLKFKGPWVELGSYQDCIHQIAGEKINNNELDINFSFLEKTNGHKNPTPQINHCKIKFGYDRKIFLKQAIFTSANNDSKNLTIKHLKANTYSFNNYGLDGNITLMLYKFYSSLTAVGQVSEINQLNIPSWDSKIEGFFRSFHYLGPIRKRPEVVYQDAGETPQDVGLEGERAINVLITNQKQDENSLLKQVKYWLNTFNIASDVELVSHTPTLYEFRLTDKRTGAVVNYPQVGFGVSQIVPLIVEGFYAPQHSVLLIEQPEIHLHPHAQSRLADLLLTVSQDNKTLIIETHSEHLLSQVQLQIAEKKLKQEDVAIYYFDPTPTGTNIVPIQINDLGQFINWPPGFFDEGLKLANAHFQAIAKAQEQK